MPQRLVQVVILSFSPVRESWDWLLRWFHSLCASLLLPPECLSDWRWGLRPLACQSKVPAVGAALLRLTPAAWPRLKGRLHWPLVPRSSRRQNHSAEGSISLSVDVHFFFLFSCQHIKTIIELEANVLTSAVTQSFLCCRYRCNRTLCVVAYFLKVLQTFWSNLYVHIC